MTDSDRYRLRFGPYTTPAFEYGDAACCELRNEVMIAGLTDAPIPWSTGRTKRGTPFIILYADLARAVKEESNKAVAKSWGMTPQTVTVWRKGLDVGRETAGTTQLRGGYADEPFTERARRKARTKARDPERRRKIAESKPGKPRPAEAMARTRAANKGLKASDETHRKRSLAHTQRGTRPLAGGVPWSAEEDELVRLLPAAEVARRTGRTLTAAYNRRITLGVPDGRRRREG